MCLQMAFERVIDRWVQMMVFRNVSFIPKRSSLCSQYITFQMFM